MKKVLLYFVFLGTAMYCFIVSLNEIQSDNIGKVIT